MMLLPTPGAAQQSSPQSGLEGLLEQLQQLQEEGLFGATGAVGLQGLDQLREGAAGQFEQSTFGFGERTQERFRVPALSSGERLLIQGFCSGEISEAEERLLRLVTRFSLLERDYCRRAGESLFQFGYEFFEGFLGPEFLVNGAIQDDYVLGIGDVLVIIFHGRDAQTVTARIDREGRMMIPNMAPIAVAGRTFGEVRRELEARTAATLTGTEVFVSLGTVRQLSVVVAGEVTRPGVHQVTGLSTALDAIGLAGGVKKTGLPPIVCSIHDEVIGPDVIGPARPQTDAGSVVEPQPASFRLLLWDLQPLPPPDALDPLGVHMPTFGPEQGSDPPIAISAILAGQADDRGRECLFIIPTTGSLALG